MADLKDLASRYGLEDYEQLLGGYPNATKFITGLKDAAVRSVPTTEQMRDPNFIIDTAGLGGAIKAYHGTPHLFDRFDMSKIGTGEGAQAYGHGLYFAENPLVAKTYMTAGVPVDEYQNKIFLKKYHADTAKLRGDKEKEAALLQEIEDMKAQKGGNIYETSIRWPNAEREATDPLGEHHLLDWDQPLSEQSDYVRNKLKKSDFYKNANKAYKDQKQWYLDPSQKTGESFLKYMRSGYDDEFASAIKDAEQYLKNLDIPGLKYLDATSRSTDKGTRNYVMFGDEYPEITKRAGSLDELKEKYAEGGIVKAQDQNENLGKLAEMLGSARDVGNQYTVPSWVPLAGGLGAGDLLMGKTPEEIENWSYGNAPMQIPEMSNVPQFKRGRAQSLADALTTLAPGVKATEDLPVGMAIKGYHGSPHKFKEFDTAHMGSGEGGQAYGWGNYITEDPYVATTYSPQDDWMDEQLMNLYNQAERRQDYPSMEVYERYMMHERPDEVKDYLNESYADYPEDLPKRLPAQKIGENLYKKQKGSHLYEVSMEFPKEREAVDPMSIEHFLDYDKPLSEQSEYVRNILQSHDPDLYHPEGADYDPVEKGSSILQRFGSGKEGAQKLYELGIPGTTYMGEKAKVANPEGVRNFVTYSDEVPRVVTRNLNKVKPITDIDRFNDLEKQMKAYRKTRRMPKGVDFKTGSDWYDWAYDKREALRQKLPNDDQGYAQGGRVDKDSLQLDKPQRTPNHPTKSHIVKTMVDGKEKIIRFGEQGAETAGKPKEGESDRMTAKRESFKARHAKNIAKGKSSAAYWADKVKWAEGGEVDLSDDSIMSKLDELAGGGDYAADLEQLKRAYPNATKFFDATKTALEDTVPTIEQMRDPDYLIEHLNPMALSMGAPEKTVKAYKLFRTKENDPDTLYPLFVNADKPVPSDEWVAAEAGAPATQNADKVKSLLGPLAYRPGWHAGDVPVATHIGKGGKPPVYRPSEHTWAEVEFPNDVDWQTLANERGMNKKGIMIPKFAHITDQLPEGGFYRYKTSPNMTGQWLIGGSMKLGKNLSDEEVKAINEASGLGVEDLPRFHEYLSRNADNPEELARVINSTAGKNEYFHMLKSAKDRELDDLLKQYEQFTDAKSLKSLDARYNKYLKKGYAEGGSVQALHDKYEESDYGYGDRPDKTKKGLGYFGELERPDGTGVMTEYSIGVPINDKEMDIPTLVPTLTTEEVQHILKIKDGEHIPHNIVSKAIEHAHKRIKEGKPVFATEKDLYANGGSVNSDTLAERLYNRAMAHFDDLMANKYADGGSVSEFEDPAHERLYRRAMAHFDDMSAKQNFGDNDSMIASTILHPVEAAKRAGNAFMRNVDIAGGRPQKILDESSWYPVGIKPSMDEQAQAGLDLAGLAQTGAMPFAPESASGVLGTIHKLRIGDLGYDLRFDDRKLEQEKLQNMMLQLTRPENEKRIISLANYEGYPFVTSMSDRTNVGKLHYINDRPVDVDLQGGQDYMFNNPGQVWASGKDPVNAIMKYGKELSARTGGLDPLYMPWRMAPTGGDYANMTGETMLKYMNANMNKKEKRAVNKSIKDFIPDFKGIESEEGIDQFRNTPDKVRKELKNHLDTKYRNAGGISIGEARLAVADPSQLLAPDTGLQNVGQIFVGNPIIQESGHRAYPKGVPGQGLGMLDRDISAYELMPDVAEYRGLMDLKNPRTRDIRALQMKPYGGIITDKVLRNLGYAKGGSVGLQELANKYM
jgi:hypothetical protein